MTPDELRQKYLNFFVARGHIIIPSAPLIPINDPSTLFTSSGMQPLVPYLLGETHPQGTRLVDSQKSFRSQDIEEIGDNRHTTFFEMLGNWSLGDYFKSDQLPWFFEFLTSPDTGLGLDPNKLYVSVFEGNDSVPRDDESIQIWQRLFNTKSPAKPGKEGFNSDTKIYTYPAQKNWWSRSGTPDKMPPGEPGGPDSEMFYDFGKELHLHQNSPFKDQQCHINCDCGRFLELGNSVFMQYQQTKKGGIQELPKKNVDYGGGLERILAAINEDPDIFNTGLFLPIIHQLEKISGKNYQDPLYTASFRVIADHIKAAVMLASDGVYPGNKEQGYFSRRLIRRAVRHGNMLGIDQNFTSDLVPVVANIYKHPYPEVHKQVSHIQQILEEEEKKFRRTLTKGLKEFDKLASQSQISATDLFHLYETYGFPLELSLEEATSRHLQLEADIESKFQDAKKGHASASRTASAGMFKGGLADHSETVTKLHTATHLLHRALRHVLGDHVHQEGSNITVERLRFDFSHPTAITLEQINLIETEINTQIQANLPVTKTIEAKDEALKSGAMAFFKEKYPDKVSVYTIGDPNHFYSKEFCGGPHVASTGEIGIVKIKKQEAIGAGKRRIYAVLANQNHQ